MTENLKPLNERTKEEQREITKKGGIASGKARREKKLMRETARSILAMTMNEGMADDISSIESIAEASGKNLTVRDQVIIAQVFKALNGDTKAAEFIRDTIGEKPSIEMLAQIQQPPVMIQGKQKLEELEELNVLDDVIVLVDDVEE